MIPLTPDFIVLSISAIFFISQKGNLIKNNQKPVENLVVKVFLKSYFNKYIFSQYYQTNVLEV